MKSEMKFDEAIQAHAAWKIKLTTYIRKPDGVLKSANVRVDDKCALGQWLHGDGKKHASLAEYGTLISEHARFHRAAGDVIDRADKGLETNGDQALNLDSEYGVASRSVVKSIKNLQKKVES
jgi:hypothetical protein